MGKKGRLCIKTQVYYYNVCSGSKLRMIVRRNCGLALGCFCFIKIQFALRGGGIVDGGDG